ncbi:MAG: hypothetical protein KKF62_13845 [Bacteroidetes bacterium]|nr:hypothetical protein [Bacteroidota bacterium]MBU1117247.1 hypothetical protein [Bacteroidota bacterium]MBU1799620.1 hypothetical protein [Bacteroidota bacterium]
MISNIKNRIANYLAEKKFAKKQKSVVSFQNYFTKANSVLIILPHFETKLSTEIIEIIRFIAIHKKKLFLIYKSDLLQYLPNDLEYASLVISDTDRTKLGLPTKDLANRMQKYTFDLVIDLNVEVNIFSSALANIPKSNFRIGFIKNKSDSFYNYQIPCEINHEKSHRNLLNSLRMF